VAILPSLASKAAADAAPDESGVQCENGLALAQPREAATLAAVPSFLRPVDGKLGRCCASAYLSLPE